MIDSSLINTMLTLSTIKGNTQNFIIMAFQYSNHLLQAGLVSVGAGLHFMVRPVNSKYFDLSEEIDAKEAVNVGAKKK